MDIHSKYMDIKNNSLSIWIYLVQAIQIYTAVKNLSILYAHKNIYGCKEFSIHFI